MTCEKQSDILVSSGTASNGASAVAEVPFVFLRQIHVENNEGGFPDEQKEIYQCET